MDKKEPKVVSTINHSNELLIERKVVFCKNPPFPHNMMVEISSICNHRCVFCGYKDMLRHGKMADMNFTKKVIREAYSYGTREIGFYLFGEPFLNPDLAEYVRFCKQIGFEYIYITTNGSEASPEKLKKVIEAGLNSIKFSVNAAGYETYKKIHGKDDYEKVKRNIIWLRRYLDKNGIELKVFISLIKCKLNEGDEITIHDEFGAYVDNIYIYECGNQGGSMVKLMKQGVVDNVLPAKMPCEMVFNRLHITAEGYLDACCADKDGYLVVADLHEMSLYDAWNCDAMVSLRQQHLEGNIGNNMCYNCINNTMNKVLPLNSIYIEKEIAWDI